MKRLVQYFGVGAVAAAIDISLFWLFAGVLNYNYLVVAFFTFIVATAANYVLSIRFVFESGVRFARHHEVLLVFLISGVGLALNQLMLYLSVAMFQLHLMLAKIVATGIVFLWNYTARSRFIFRARP